MHQTSGYSLPPVPALPALLFFVILISFSACDDNRITAPELLPIGQFDTTGVPSFKAENGLKIYFHQEGTGDILVERQSVRVRYTGRTLDGNIFDSSKNENSDEPRTLRISSMISGFMQGLVGVVERDEETGTAVRKYAAREGSVRTLVIPPELGYGGTNHRLSEDTLIFDIEIIAIATDE